MAPCAPPVHERAGAKLAGNAPAFQPKAADGLLSNRRHPLTEPTP